MSDGNKLSWENIRGGGCLGIYISPSLLHMASAIATFTAAVHHHTLAGNKL